MGEKLQLVWSLVDCWTISIGKKGNFTLRIITLKKMHLNQEKNSQMCIEIAVEHGRRYDKLKEENNRGNKGGAPYLRKCRS